MTEWFEYGVWHNDLLPPEKRTIPERKILSWRIAEILPRESPDIVYWIQLDCGHEVSELVKFGGIPKGLYRLCEKCKNGR
jgi:hypothetical protein